jgi:hypothetical protein
VPCWHCHGFGEEIPVFRGRYVTEGDCSRPVRVTTSLWQAVGDRLRAVIAGSFHWICDSQWMALQPQCARRRQRIDSDPGPPGRLIATVMEFAMMPAAQRNGELVADLAAERPALSEAQMMGVRRASPTDQTWLFSNIPDVVSVADAAWLGESKSTFVDRAR